MNPEQFIPGQNYIVQGKRIRSVAGGQKNFQTYVANGIFEGYAKNGNGVSLIMAGCSLTDLRYLTSECGVKFLLPYKTNSGEGIEKVNETGLLERRTVEIVVFKNGQFKYPLSFVQRSLDNARYGEIELKLSARHPSESAQRSYLDLLKCYGEPDSDNKRSGFSAKLRIRPSEIDCLEGIISQIHAMRKKRLENNRMTITLRVQTYGYA